MGFYLGIDTSNYTTSFAGFDGENIIHSKRLLPVKEGERGLRQSDAVFHHTKAYAELYRSLLEKMQNRNILAVGASVTPTTASGSYMPCFLVGENAGKAIAETLAIPFYGFSHQQGHIAAALYSSNRLDLLEKSFLCFHISGGTTDLLRCDPSKENIIEVTPIASSNDLKAGQAIDRIGVEMGFKFPAGRELEICANQSERKFKNKIKLYEGNCSFSGIENKCKKMLLDGESKEDTALFLLTYIADTLTAMAEYALNEQGDLPLIFAGGVMSDKIIKDIISSRFEADFATPEFSCDNAGGIALLASLK